MLLLFYMKNSHKIFIPKSTGYLYSINITTVAAEENPEELLEMYNVQ